MKNPLLFAAALSLAMPIYVTPSGAAPKRVEGRVCNFPHVKPGTWVGFFDGWEAVTRLDGADGRESVTVWRCFQTKAECTAWKYWMQTDYRAGPQLTWCKRK